ncbi:MAG: hypothetical protein HC784_09480 [Hydrococcus sp. CSU_1_8]|nr:hypothetical protein [Hydrococcus sp. CSU_1_8]
MMKNFFWVTFWLLLPTLQSCDLVAAVLAQGGELTLKAKDNWDYAAKVMPPELIKQVRQNFEAHWIGDPKRFQAVKVQQFGQKSPLYFIDPYIPCPESGCTSQELYDLYHPGCNVSGGCLKFAYVQQENGTFRRVFEQLFYQQPTADDVFLKVSSQLDRGYPACFEMAGFDDERRRQGLPETGQHQVFVSRYCYNGQDYVFQQMFVVPSKRY